MKQPLSNISNNNDDSKVLETKDPLEENKSSSNNPPPNKEKSVEPASPDMMDVQTFVSSTVEIAKQKYVITAMKTHLVNDTQQYKSIIEWEEIFNKLYNTGV